MAKRILTQQQRRWLQDETESWQALGLVDVRQVHDILDLYEMPQESAARQRSVAVFVLMSLAALLVGLAALLLIGYNWEAMSAATKLAIIFGGILALHGAGFYLRYRSQHPVVAAILFFLGCFGYGLGIWLIAQ